MKKYFILVLALFVTSCQEDDPKHPIEGTWDDKYSDSYLRFDSNTLSAYADYYSNYEGAECRLEADWEEINCDNSTEDNIYSDGCLMFSNPALEYASGLGQGDSEIELCGLYVAYDLIRESQPEVRYTASSDTLYLSSPFYMSLSRR